MRPGSEPVAAITADPVAGTQPQEGPPAPGVLVLPTPNEPTARRLVPLGPASVPRPDYIEPWTGENLEPVIVAARRGYRIDRADPWNPNLIHEISPQRRELPDEADPWSEVTTVERRRQPKRDALSIDKDSPWPAEAVPPESISL